MKCNYTFYHFLFYLEFSNICDYTPNAIRKNFIYYIHLG